MKLWKVLAVAAAAVALVPYQIDKDEEAGTTSLKALLWSATHTPKTEERNDTIVVNMGLNLPEKAETEMDVPETDVSEPDEAGLYDDNVILVETPLTPDTAADAPAAETDPA